MKSQPKNTLYHSSTCTEPMQFTQNFKTQREFVAQLLKLEYYKDYTEEQIEQIIDRRISRFYGSNDQIDVAEEHYKPKLEPIYCPGDQTVDDTLIIFGVDFITTATLKELFAARDPAFTFEPVDTSNFILRYSQAKYARAAILQNLKRDSVTAFKVEQDIPQSLESQLAKTVKILPKQWIELKPYTYRHFFRSEKLCPHLFRDYERRLFVRYATDKERAVGKVTLKLVEQLYNKCNQIWRVQAERDNQLKRMVFLKLREFKERKEMVHRKVNQTKVMEGIVENAGKHVYQERSRSRPRFYRNDSNEKKHTGEERQQNISTGEPYSHLNNSRGEKLSLQIKHHKQMAEMNDLIDRIQGINIQIQARQAQKNKPENKDDLVQLCQQLGKLNFSKLKADFIPIPSKVAQPSQLRRQSYRKERFKYHQYIKRNEELQSRVRKFTQVDLTLQ